jgi:ABC-type branched-subunit amino acid transport system permease subunit
LLKKSLCKYDSQLYYKPRSMIYGLRILLFILISIGLYGAFSVSYQTITGSSGCPELLSVPICFVVLTGYSLMMITHQLRPTMLHKMLFSTGLLPVFLLAWVGSAFELFIGNTCPKNNLGIALCYVSLALSISISILYWIYVNLRKTPSTY